LVLGLPYQPEFVKFPALACEIILSRLINAHGRNHRQ